MGFVKSIVGSNVSDPFVRVTVPRTLADKKKTKECVWETKTINNSLEPTWKEEHA